MEQVVAGADHTGESGFVQPHFLKEDQTLVHIHRNEIRLDRCRNDNCVGAFGLGFFEHTSGKGITARRFIFVDVADVQDRLGGQELRLREKSSLLLVLWRGQPRGPAFAEQLERLAQN